MYILGISAYFHDSAAALLKDGVIIAAMQEERFSRVKHDKSFPLLSIHNCLETSGISIEQVNYIVSVSYTHLDVYKRQDLNWKNYFHYFISTV